MGFSHSDFLELQRLQANLGKIRFGPRASRPPPIQLGFLPQIEKPRRPGIRERGKPPEGPGYEKHQLRQW